MVVIAFVGEPWGNPARTRRRPIDATLSTAYETCRRMHRRHDPTYYWATRRLPADVRPAVHALYGFVRGADELVDGPRRPNDPAARRAALDRWHGALEDGRARGGSEHPVIAALVDAGDRHALPLDELRVYMRSMRVDCDRVRIETWDDLRAYMNGSAASVGRIMAPLLGAPPEQRETFATLGVAFQLTNFVRDVREDWTLDRIYLPAQDRAQYGVGESEISARVPTAGFRALVAVHVARARELFAASASEACAAVAPRVRPGMRLATAVYLAVLQRVERHGYDVLRQRADLAPWEVARAAGRSLRVAGAEARANGNGHVELAA